MEVERRGGGKKYKLSIYILGGGVYDEGPVPYPQSCNLKCIHNLVSMKILYCISNSSKHDERFHPCLRNDMAENKNDFDDFLRR